MVEANAGVPDAFKPSEEEQLLINLHLGKNYQIDNEYKSSVLLKKTEAEKRKSLVSEIEYDYQLALNKGEYYIGSAVVNFYLENLP